MIKIKFEKTKDSPLDVLCLGAHSDDIEIGCGGTVLRLISEYGDVKITWVVFGADGERKDEASQSAEVFLEGVRSKQITVNGFKDGFFPYIGGQIKEYFEGLKKQFKPDVVLTHFRNDLHQDHRLISELTWNTFRDHLILEYEIPKYDGDLGAPNFFVSLTKATCLKKAENILRLFMSQRMNHWFTQDTFLSILRIRGIECNAEEGYAEAFYCRKMIS